MSKKWPYVLILTVVGLVLITPIIYTLFFSFTTEWVALTPGGFTLAHWKRLLTQTPEFWTSIGRSLMISGFPIFISGMCVILAMYAAILYYPKIDAVIQSICMIPYTLKGVVLSVSVLGLYAGKGTVFSNRMVMLVCVYCVVILPHIYRGIRNNLYAINVHRLIEAAEILGAGKLYAFFRVVIPNMVSGILVSAMLALSSIFTDYAVVNIIAGSRYITAQIVLYNISRSVGGQLTSAIVIIVFVTTLVVSAIAYGLQNWSAIRTSIKRTEE